MNRKLPDFVDIGYIDKPHGIKGEVKVRPTTDHPLRFKQLKSVLIEFPHGAFKKLEISKVTVQGQIVYLCFKKIDSRQQALALKGSTIKIKRDECLPLEEGQFYHFEIVGLKVKTNSGEYIGCIEEVWDFPANAVFVARNKEREILIPAIKDVIRKIDVKKGEIIIHPMEGLLE
ncbi:MAG: ribosome maturation factor RimM [bacterium]